MFRVVITSSCIKGMKKLCSKRELFIIEEFIDKQLTRKGFVGKPLGVSFFREVKFGVRRLYFLIYQEIRIILVVAISNKKEQQAIINSIKRSFPEFKRLAHSFLR